MTPYPIDHVAIATPSIDESAPLVELLTGAMRSRIEDLVDEGVRVAFVGPVELLEPLSAGSPLARFLDRRGQGLHHVAFRVPDIAASVAAFEAEGLRLAPGGIRRGAGDRRVAFLHPRSAGGVLWELVEG